MRGGEPSEASKGATGGEGAPRKGACLRFPPAVPMEATRGRTIRHHQLLCLSVCLSAARSPRAARRRVQAGTGLTLARTVLAAMNGPFCISLPVQLAVLRTWSVTMEAVYCHDSRAARPGSPTHLHTTHARGRPRVTWSPQGTTHDAIDCWVVVLGVQSIPPARNSVLCLCCNANLA